MTCPKCKQQIATVYEKGRPIVVYLSSLHVSEESAIIGRLQVTYLKYRHKKHDIKTCKKDDKKMKTSR